ncbi:hypothetical protein C0993_009623 [Termitomyces sp. T159_Od127]|nr:hypothetical protein C0993_009623 [Termitomyces sp. T159_Od127]
MSAPAIHIDTARIIDEVDPRIYSGFTEHMGRCIYGGIYDPDNQHGLVDPKTGFRTDVLEALKELNIPLVRYPGGSANTYWANRRRKNGHEKPYNVKGTKSGDPGKMESQDYAKKAFQWAKALKLLDPNINLISCGETGFSDWDRVTLKKLAPVVDFHSIHLYTVSEGKHAVNVMGPAAAEKGLEITRALIDLAKIEGELCKELTICFDEWNVWDPVRAPGEKGAEEHYDLSDALAVAAWLNVFVRKADIVKIACIAQSVNVISPIVTSPTGLFRQTTYYPLHLFANLMQGTSLDVFVSAPSPATFYTGPTVPKFMQHLTTHTPDTAKLTKYVDVSAVLSRDGREVRVAVVNRHREEGFVVPIRFAGGAETVQEEVRVYEVWSQHLGDGNTFGEERVKTVERRVRFTGVYELKKHSFQGMGG